ncbi:MAG: DUF951 domain-containing protein [Lachnospiraceae bacterium]|nr:DUF951 domain-containing protein [Lachnospiraceae bacterium]
MLQIETGDTLKLKKKHPCGSDLWEVLRLGSDLKLRCQGCGRTLMLPRYQVEKNLKELIPKEEIE